MVIYTLFYRLNVHAGRQRIVDVLHGIPGPLPVAKTAVKTS